MPPIAERLGQELARIHTIRPPRSDLGFLPPYEQSRPAQQIAAFRTYLDSHPAPRPVLEWGIRWLETHMPAPVLPVLCHHDFRTGNYLLDGAELTGILDWEFAGWGDPHEDIGWFCSKGWRFARLDREAGGIADRAPFYRGYENEGGAVIDPLRVRFWEVLASVRWAMIALQQSDRHRLGGERSLDLALTGRRASECELEILTLLDRACEPGSRPLDRQSSASPKGAEPPAMHDLPDGPALLALARDVLLNDLMPLLPLERRLEALLVANCMAVAEREANTEVPEYALLRELAVLYHPEDPSSPVSGTVGKGSEILRRFACELRNGAFENSPDRDTRARAILWRMTIARLRLANPKFLAANGFA